MLVWLSLITLNIKLPFSSHICGKKIKQKKTILHMCTFTVDIQSIE